MRDRIISTFLIFIFLTLISTAASAAPEIIIGSGSQPAIDATHGTKVAWTDAGVIHVYDLTTQDDNTISSAEASYPAICGNKLVWHDESSGMPRLTVYDISTAAKTYITQNVDSDSIPAIYCNRIVWSANNYVYMYDIPTSMQTEIASGSNPDIYNNEIVYESDTAGDTPQIYAYNINTGTAIDISEIGSNKYSHIYGNKIIWSDFNTRLGNIRMYDIATGEQTEITTGDDTTGYDTGGSTDIRGDKIVYVKRHGESLQSPYIGIGDIYVYSIANEQSNLLFASNTAETPVVSCNSEVGNIVVWSDSGCIYMTNI